MHRNLILAAAALLALQGCSRSAAPRTASADDESLTLAARKQLVSPSGTTHRVYPPNRPDSPCWLAPDDARAAIQEFSETQSLSASGGRDAFTGTARKAVKASIADGPELQDVSTISDLYDWTGGELEDEEVPEAERADRENFNATVSAELVAAKFEGDNDYHLILTDEAGNFWTAEVSGLPKRTHRDYAALKAARDQFHDMVEGARPTASRYDTYSPPIPVVVSGSLFFDSEHTVRPECGPIGPGSCKPCTAWELHPVTAIRFAEE